MALKRPWVVYMLRCGDDTLYVGVSNRLDERLEAHRAGRGARYTRGRGPLDLLYVEHAGTRPEALRRERQLKRLKRRQKLQLAGVPS
jgi:putative endonuclease